MITEDYVSFETAKLLKEKGFKGDRSNFYKRERLIDFHNYWWRITPKERYEAIEAPTLQMVMKWLREVHKLYIEITPSSKTNEFIVDSYRIDIVTRFFDTIYVSSGYNTYEEACEAAIKYCLENLI